VAIFRIGSSRFILSSFEPAENFMMQLMVDGLEAVARVVRKEFFPR
jgi:hypothetical protein